MDKAAFNRHLDNLLVQAQLEEEGSKFTQAMNKFIVEQDFDESTQAFLFISVDNTNQVTPGSFTAFAGDAKGQALLLQAIELFLRNMGKRIADKNEY